MKRKPKIIKPECRNCCIAEYLAIEGANASRRASRVSPRAGSRLGHAATIAFAALSLSSCDDNNPRSYVDVSCQRGGKVIFSGIVENEPGREVFGDGITLTTPRGEHIFFSKVDSCRAKRIVLRPSDLHDLPKE